MRKGRAGQGSARQRHTVATRLVMNGVDIVTVKELLGHKTLAMTMRYSNPTPEHKKWAVEMLNLGKMAQIRHNAANDTKEGFLSGVVKPHS